MEALQLERQDLIGRGQNRCVFRHPGHVDRCIKVARSDGWRRRHDKRETGYWQALARRGCDFRHMPAYYGCVETSYGRGSVWQLARSADSHIAKTLARCLRRGIVRPDVQQEALSRFFDWSLEHSVLSHDLNLLNFVCPFDDAGDFSLKLIDGWGNNEYLPVSSFSRVLARRKIVRVWRRFERRFEKYVARHIEAESPIILPFPTTAAKRNESDYRRAA